MATKDDLLAVLSRHIGAERGLTVKDLARELGVEERQVRRMVEQLRAERVEVCAHPRCGYHIAATPEEALAAAQFLIKRAKKSLMLASRMTGQSLAELAGQMTLPT